MHRALSVSNRILCAFALFGGLGSAAWAGPADQASLTDKLKALEFRELGPAVMGRDENRTAIRAVCVPWTADKTDFVVRL